MMFRPSASADDARDPFSAAFTTWSRSVMTPWLSSFGTVCAPLATGAGTDPTAPFLAMLELQRAMMRNWLDLVTMPLAAFAPAAAPAAARPPQPPKPAPAPAKAPLASVPAPVTAPTPTAAPLPVPAPQAIAPVAPPAPVVEAPRAVVTAPVPAADISVVAVAAVAPALIEAPAPAMPAAPVKPRTAKKAAPPAAPAIDPTGLFDDDLVEKTAPPTLPAADGEPDDLQAIKGIGPKLKQLLNDIGIYHYRQIAAWTPGEIAWMNAKIDFKGRVQRERWVAQARTLANG